MVLGSWKRVYGQFYAENFVDKILGYIVTD